MGPVLLTAHFPNTIPMVVGVHCPIWFTETVTGGYQTAPPGSRQTYSSFFFKQSQCRRVFEGFKKHHSLADAVKPPQRTNQDLSLADGTVGWTWFGCMTRLAFKIHLWFCNHFLSNAQSRCWFLQYFSCNSHNVGTMELRALARVIVKN